MKFRWLALGLIVVALLVPALMITGARLVEPSDGRVIRLVSFTPYAVILYALALLPLLLALVAGRGTWRRAGGWLCLPVASLLALHLFWASGLYVGPDEAAGAAGEDATFTVMCVNMLLGNADPDQVVELAIEHEADVLVVSEITPQGLAALRKAGLAEEFAHAEGTAAGGVVGTMVFSTRELSGVAALDTTFGGYSMKVRTPMGEVDLIAVHANPPTGDAVDWRADHVTIRRAAVAATGPTVLAGDFNATLDHQQMRELGGLGFRDAAERANSGWQPTWPASREAPVLGIALPPMLQIDHVLVGDGLKVVDTDTARIAGADHLALFATLG